MEYIIDEICGYLRNYFTSPKDIHIGTYTVNNGTLTLPFLADGQYYRIVGSVFNDGVHKYGETGLTSETFDGAVWAMAIPPEVIALSEKISEWCDENASALESPYQSESFGGYSYSKASGADGGTSWRDAFGAKLARWRKI